MCNSEFMVGSLLSGLSVSHNKYKAVYQIGDKHCSLELYFDLSAFVAHGQHVVHIGPQFCTSISILKHRTRCGCKGYIPAQKKFVLSVCS